MARKRADRHPKPPPAIKVNVEHIPTPDAQRRLTRSFDLLMRAGARHEQQKKA